MCVIFLFFSSGMKCCYFCRCGLIKILERYASTNPVFQQPVSRRSLPLCYAQNGEMFPHPGPYYNFTKQEAGKNQNAPFPLVVDRYVTKAVLKDDEAQEKPTSQDIPAGTKMAAAPHLVKGIQCTKTKSSRPCLDKAADIVL